MKERKRERKEKRKEKRTNERWSSPKSQAVMKKVGHLVVGVETVTFS